jgi:hypothetical protein
MPKKSKTPKIYEFCCCEYETSFYKFLNTIATLNKYNQLTVSFILLFVILFVYRYYIQGDLDFSMRFLSAVCRDCVYRYDQDNNCIIM